MKRNIVEIISEYYAKTPLDFLEEICEKTGCNLTEKEMRDILLKGKEPPWEIKNELRALYNKALKEEKETLKKVEFANGMMCKVILLPISLIALILMIIIWFSR